MRQLTMLLFIVVAIVLGVGLFWAKVQVQALEDQKAQLARSIVSERQSIRVLKAEWALLNDPARLRGLAERHLKMVPVGARQIAGIDDSKVLPVAATPDAPGANMSGKGGRP